MKFDLQTFYEQLGAIAEVLITRRLPNGQLYERFYTDDATIDVIIDVHTRKVISIIIQRI